MKTEDYQRVISAVRGQIRHCGKDPRLATSHEIEAAASEVAVEFIRHATDYQWQKFMRMFRKWQKHDN